MNGLAFHRDYEDDVVSIVRDPCTHLVAAVIQQAVEDLTFRPALRFKRSVQRSEWRDRTLRYAKEIRDSAREWLLSRKTDRHSLAWYCEQIGMDANVVRRRARLLLRGVA